MLIFKDLIDRVNKCLLGGKTHTVLKLQFRTLWRTFGSSIKKTSFKTNGPRHPGTLVWLYERWKCDLKSSNWWHTQVLFLMFFLEAKFTLVLELFLQATFTTIAHKSFNLLISHPVHLAFSLSDLSWFFFLTKHEALILNLWVWKCKHVLNFLNMHSF